MSSTDPEAYLYAAHVTRDPIQQQLIAQLRLRLQQLLEDVTECTVHRLSPRHGHQQLQGLLLSLGTSGMAGLQIQLSELMRRQLIGLKEESDTGLCHYFYLQQQTCHECEQIKGG